MLRQFLPLAFRHQNAMTMFHWTIGTYAQHRAVGQYLDELPKLQDTLVEAWQGIEGPLEMAISLDLGELVIPRTTPQLDAALQEWIFVLEAIRQTQIGHLLDQPLTDWISQVARLRYLIHLN